MKKKSNLPLKTYRRAKKPPVGTDNKAYYKLVSLPLHDIYAVWLPDVKLWRVRVQLTQFEKKTYDYIRPNVHFTVPSTGNPRTSIMTKDLAGTVGYLVQQYLKHSYMGGNGGSC